MSFTDVIVVVVVLVVLAARLWIAAMAVGVIGLLCAGWVWVFHGMDKSR